MNSSAFVLASFLGLLAAAGAETLFQDGFESGLSSWSITTTNDGRGRVITDDGPAAGSNYLLLDDAIDDAIFSVAEAGITLDLTDRKNVTLFFKTRHFGNENHGMPDGNFTTTRNYDGVAISCDGGTNWRSVRSLTYLSSEWGEHVVPLDSAIRSLGGRFEQGMRIRFSAYDNSPAPLDGIAIDEVLVTADFDPRVTVDLPGTVVEGSGPQTGYISLNAARPQPVTVTLSPNLAAITVPASVTIPAGALSASFQVSAPEDDLVTLRRQVTVSASASGFSSTPAVVDVMDNEAVQAVLTLPGQVTEGGGALNATLTLTPAPAIGVDVPLSTSPAGELSVPVIARLSPGQSTANFTVAAMNDGKFDGDIPVTVTARPPGLAPLSSTVVVVDNEARTLGLTPPPFVLEGTTGTVIVKIPGTLPELLPVNLVGTATMLVPATVFIPAGATQVEVPVTVSDNDLLDGARHEALTASADGFAPFTQQVAIRDNDAASYAIGAPYDLIPVGTPLEVGITARDVAGNIINGYVGRVDLDLVLPGGESLPVSPSSVNLSGSGWTGTVTLPETSASGQRLRGTDARGTASLTATFDPILTLDIPAADLAWNPHRGVIYASIPVSAEGPHAGRVLEIDPATAEIRRSVLTNQDPGQLALTSGGEYLYAAQNGNGRVAKIDPATMTVTSSFYSGTGSNSSSPLVAGDLCTVAGEPELLVVSLMDLRTSTIADSVVAFENGVAREARADFSIGEGRIEPSTDPTKFWLSSGNEVSRLVLDADGIHLTETGPYLPQINLGDVRSGGDRIYGTSGDVIEVSSLTRAGKVSVRGPVYPDTTLNTAYYVERSSNNQFTAIGSYDATTFARIRQMTMPTIGHTAGSLIRWGAHGLAFRSATKIHIVASPALVPSSDPADLAVSVTATPPPVAPGATLTYTVTVENLGPNAARGGILSVALSGDQTLRGASASTGNAVATATAAGSQLSLILPDIAIAARQTLTITVDAGATGSVACSARVAPGNVDSDITNNHTVRLVNVGYQAGPDSINRIRLAASSLVADPTRNLVWAVVPAAEGTFEHSVVSIEPLTGFVSAPIPLGHGAQSRTAALSANGRYLYVGLAGLPQIARIDLFPARPVVERVNMESGQPWDIEVLDGDGTSILVIDSSSRLHLINGLTGQAPAITHRGEQIQRTATPDVYFCMDASSSYHFTSLVRATPAGLTDIRSEAEVMGVGVISLNEIWAGGDRILSNRGHLVDSTEMTLITTVPATGVGCVDGETRRAYMATNGAVRSYDADTGATGPVLPINSRAPQICIRWGTDGLAVRDEEGMLQIIRWAAVAPGGGDADGDGVPDFWATQHFGAAEIPAGRDWDRDGVPDVLEYLFASSPVRGGASPLGSAVEREGPARTVVLHFPRRAGVPAGSYRIEVSDDAEEWAAAPTLTETVLSTATVDGVAVQNMEARIPMATPARGFARIKWLKP